MKRLSEELLEYFSNTPEEQLQKDWEAIHSKYAYGPEINQFIEECEKNCSRYLRKPSNIQSECRIPYIPGFRV